jgi:2-dehydro-3-deoxygluconokinase
MAIEIRATGRSIPLRRITNDDLAKKIDTSDAWIRSHTGIGARHIAEPETACSDLSLEAVQAAKKAGLTVSCDLNFRKKLWRWEPGTDPHALSAKIMGKLLPSVDVLIANEEDVQDVLGIRVDAVNTDTGNINVQKYPDIARKVTGLFPQLKKIAFTLRESVSATHNNWGGLLYDTATGNAVFAPLAQDVYAPYQIHAIVDRIGGGDSFSAALIYALTDDVLKKRDEDVIAFAAAGSCLCHSIKGDFNFSSREEVLALMKGKTSGRIVR